MFRSLRSVASRPVLAVVVIATLALGLGVNSAIFSLTREVLLRPLPYRDADRLVRVFESSPTLGRRSAPVAPANYVAWRDRLDAFETTAAFRRVAFNVVMRADALQLEGFQIAPSFFRMLGVEPALGRNFTNDDAAPGRDAVVLLSHGVWHRQFGGDAGIVGRSIRVDGTPCVVVGVLPPSFTIFRVLNREVDLFRPLVVDPTDREQSINVYAKLKRGATVDLARAQLTAAYSSMPTPGPWSADLALLSTSFAEQSRPVLLALEWAAALVLLIACANIANLLLALAAGRSKEVAVRSALGAGRWRIARDFAGEIVLLTVGGGVSAVLLAAWIIAVLNGTVSFQDINRLHPFRVDAWVVGFTAVLTLAVGVVFGILPAHTAAGIDIAQTLKESTSAASAGVANRRLRRTLVVGELALSIVLATSALTLTRSVLAFHGFGRGINIDRLMTAQVTLNDPEYNEAGRLVHAASSMLGRLAASPETASAALVNYPPLSLIRVGVPVSIEGRPAPGADTPWIARYWVATPNYFHTLGIPILAGRDFTAADDATGAGVAIVGEGFARRFWNQTDVVGRRVKTHFPQSTLFWIPRARRDVLTIVGVVGDVREDGLTDAAGLPQLYLPYAQNPTTTLTLVVRAGMLPAERAMPAMREAVRTVDPGAAIGYEKSYDTILREAFGRPREMAWVVGSFAVLALVLSAIGVYGTMAYMTAARTREIGIRVALGATVRDVASLILRETMMMTAAGVAIGVVAAPMATRLMSGLLFGVGPYDSSTILTIAAVLTAVSIAAAAIPIVRAARVGPASFR